MANEEAPKEEYCEFAFKVPNAPPGATMKVTAPDGTVLKIPLPRNVEAGMKLVMHKTEETHGAWRIKNAEAGDDEESPARQQAPQVQVAQRQEPQATSQLPAPAAPEAKKESVASRTVAKASQGGRPRTRTKDELVADLSGPSVVTVKLDTSKGPIIMKVVPQWAPLGAERFLQLINDGYYSEIAIYRAVPKFLVQFGIVKDKARTGKYKKIQDDPLCGVPIQDGTVIFAAAGANTRKSTVCLFLGDYPQLGASPWETPIGKVEAESMSILHSIYTGYGDIPQCNGKGPDPHKLEELGNSYIAEQFPKCDYVTGASRV